MVILNMSVFQTRRCKEIICHNILPPLWIKSFIYKSWPLYFSLNEIRLAVRYIILINVWEKCQCITNLSFLKIWTCFACNYLRDEKTVLSAHSYLYNYNCYNSVSLCTPLTVLFQEKTHRVTVGLWIGQLHELCIRLVTVDTFIMWLSSSC